MNIGVLVSDRGTLFEATELAIRNGEIQDINIAYVICNNGPGSREVWKRAHDLGKTIYHVSNKTQTVCTLPVVEGVHVPGTISYEASDKMVNLARKHDVQMYVALGFMKKLIGSVLNEFEIANEHQGPLGPERLTAGFPGDLAQEEVMRLGLDYSGPTMHWMDRTLDKNGLPQYDMGEEIGHEPVKVTEEMRDEWRMHQSVGILTREVRAVELAVVPGWIQKAAQSIQ